jgi:pyocin large subunit-like protein
VKRENHCLLATASCVLAFALAACDAGPSASSHAAAAPSAPAAAAQTAAADPRDAPVPLVHGKPMWAANRRHTAEENADYQFTKNGKDFGAVTEADYVAKAHAFVDAPPASVKRIERANGDALLYDAKTNTFAVVTKTGAPRTMFKPKNGAAYWREQVARESERSRGADQAES